MIGGKLMRGVETRIQEIRHRIFREVARMAYHTEWPVDKRIEELPYKIIPGEVGNFRNDVFLERAIVGERLRLAMGLPYRGASDPAPVSQGIEEADKPETYYTPPLINVIKFACNACPEKRVYVTDGCQGCLAHPCVEVCPKDAVSLDRTNGRSRIDPDKCIKCGQCANVCCLSCHHHPGAPLRGGLRHGCYPLGRERKGGYQLRQVRFLRTVPRELPVRSDRGQVPDLPGHPRHPDRRARLRCCGTGVCRSVRPEGHTWKAACGDEGARLLRTSLRSPSARTYAQCRRRRTS